MFPHSLLRQKIKSCVIVLSLSILTACVANTPATVPPVAKSVGVGTGIVNPGSIANLYDEFCYKHSPTFSGSITSLKANKNFKQQPETGTFFHQTLELSVNAKNRGGKSTCSMVFKTRNSDNFVQNTIYILVPFTTKPGGAGKMNINDNGGVVINSNPAKNVYYDISIRGLSRLMMKTN